MSDLVSRQKVIEVIDAVMPVDPNKSEYASGIACGAALAMTYVKQLPSAQPDRSLWFRIGEICVDESKGFISSGRAVEKIRELLREAERRKE